MKKIKKLKKSDIKNSSHRCYLYRKTILDLSQKVQALHGGGAFSCLEILDYIYFHLLDNFKISQNEESFILSKGHSAVAQYTILNYLKIISKKDLFSYCKKDGYLGCHPDIGNPGIEASTGSLGHGLALSLGMAQALKIKKINNKKIYVLISDGELQEGSTWESLMMAGNLSLENLILFIDHNGSQSFGVTRETHPNFYPIKQKLSSFGWDTRQCNGHKINEINDCLLKKNTKPLHEKTALYA